MRKLHLHFSKALLFFVLMTASHFAAVAQDDVKALARKWIGQNNKVLKLDKEELDGMRINSAYTSSEGITYAYAEQFYKGIKVYNGVYSFAFKKGVLLSHASSFIHAIKTKAGSSLPAVTPQTAVLAAAADLEAGEVKNLVVIAPLNADNKIIFSPAGIAREDIKVELVWILLLFFSSVCFSFTVFHILGDTAPGLK